MANPLTRRSLLTAGAIGAAWGLAGRWLPRAVARPDEEISVEPALIVLFLRGGQDALNVLVPHAEGRYHDLRPNIGIAPPGEPGGAIDLDGTFGFHPALPGLAKLFRDEHLAPVVCTGLHTTSRSHFDCQDFMEHGFPDDKTVKTGWLNRYLAATTGPAGPAEGELRALALQGRLPRSLRGTYPVLAVPDSVGVARRSAGGGEGDVLSLFDPLYPGAPPHAGPAMRPRPQDGAAGEAPDRLERSGRTTIDTLRHLDEILSTAPAGGEVTYPPEAGRLGQQLARAARLLKAGQGLQVVGIDWNGWDHHIQEGGPREKDLLFRMLAQLDAAITTFFEDVAAMRSHVVLVTMTEFGRTNAENGNRGTDHGHGSVMLVAGGNVKGGSVKGEWTTLATGKTYQNRDLEVTTDYRTVLREVLTGHLGCPTQADPFPGFRSEQKLGLF